MMVPVKMHKAAKFAIRKDCISDELKTYLLKTMGCSRKLYNLYVEHLYNILQKCGYKSGDLLPDYTVPEVTFFKKDYPYMKEADSLALTNARKSFIDAKDDFNNQENRRSYTKRALRRAKSGTEPLSFRGLAGMPKFHAKSRGYFSYTTNCQYPGDGNNLKNPTIRLDGDHLRIPKWKKDIILVIDRSLPKDAVIKHVTISMDIDGQFFVSLNYEYTIDIVFDLRNATKSGNRSVVENLRFLGLDYSNPDFYVDSEGRIPNCPKAYRNAQDKLAKLQRKLSKMEKDSSNYCRMKAKIDRLHKHIRNQRKDFAYKEANKLASAYDVVVVEDIDLRAMSGGLKLGKGLMDNAFGMFRTQLAHKLWEKGSVLVKVGKWYPSTQTCSVCGYVSSGDTHIDLGVDEWTCPECGTHHNRDHNAAVNIREEGKRIFLAYFAEKLEEDRIAREKTENLSNALKAPRKRSK